MARTPQNFTRNHYETDKYLLTSLQRQAYMHMSRFRSPGVYRSKNTICGVHRMAEIREVMGVREASEYLGVSREALYKYVDEEKIPAFKLGNRWKFKKTLLDRWMETRSTHSEHRLKRKQRLAAR
jgi:excisionase family DNA binding protein